MCVSNLEFIMTYFPFVGRKKPEIMIEFAEKKVSSEMSLI